MNGSTQDDPAREIFRSASFKSRGSLFLFLLIAGAIYVAVMLYLKVFWLGDSPGKMLMDWLWLPMIVTVLYVLGRFSWSVWVYDTKLVVKTYLLDSLLRIPVRQEIPFEEIEFVYYLEKEYNLLLNYRKRLEKYGVSKSEMNYRREHLIQKYGVRAHDLDAFEHSSQKTLNDNSATGVLMAVEETLDRYKIQKSEKKEIIKELKKTDDFTFEHVARLLSPHAITQTDLDDLKDSFSDLNADVWAPFLETKLAVAKVESYERGRGGMVATIEVNCSLVLSNQDGSKKVYVTKFHSLSRADWQKLIHIMNEKKPGIRYLMSRQSYRNISDPNFQARRM